MYTRFYNLAERPFELTPDLTYLYLSEEHREALDHLSYGVEQRRGFVQLTGEVGTGKTTMLDALVSGLDATTMVVRLAHTTIDDVELLRILARGLGVETRGGKAELLDGIGTLLRDRAHSGRNTVLVVDEAQNLGLSVLEEIRLLSNMRHGDSQVLQIILAGQPELRDKLELRALRQLRQRIGIRYHLAPLSRPETGEYIRHRIRVAGGEDDGLFSRAAVDVVYEYAGGIPRVINTVCDQALLGGYAGGKRRIGPEIVADAVDSIEGYTIGRRDAEVPSVARPGRPSARPRPRWSSVVLSAAVLAVLVAFLSQLPDVRQDLLRAAGTRGAGGRAGAAPISAVSRAAPAATMKPRAESPVAVVEPDEVSAEAAERGLEAETELLRGPGGRYRVVVASSRRTEAARSEITRLEAVGIASEIVDVDLGDEGVWYRVVVAGGFPSLEEAGAIVRQLGEVGYDQAWISR